LEALRSGRVAEFAASLRAEGNDLDLQSLVAFGLRQDDGADRASARVAFEEALALPHVGPRFVLDVLVRPNLDDPPRVRRALDRLGTAESRGDVMTELSELAKNTLTAGRAQTSLVIYKFLLQQPDPALGDFAGAMAAALSADEIPEADRLVARALPLGHRHPVLFHHAARVYARSGKLQLALHAAMSAKQHNYEDLQQMREDEALAPLFEKQAFVELFDPS